MTKRSGGQGRKHMDRDIESQIPASNKKSTSISKTDDINKPSGEKIFVGPQQKTSILPISSDVENPLQNNSEFSGLGANSGYGIFDDRFCGGKLRRVTQNRRKHILNKRKIKTTRKRKSNRKKYHRTII